MEQKRIVIVGATSGIGLELAKYYIARGWRVGVVGRNRDMLYKLVELSPENVVMKRVDIMEEKCDKRLYDLMTELGGVDVYLHVAGVGFNTGKLTPEAEATTVATNALGFVRSILSGFTYLSENGGGKLAAITSIAGTRGLSVVPAYSATKSFQQRYLQALAQLSNTQHLGVSVIDIRPGFVDTPLLNPDHRYPMLMKPRVVAHQAAEAIARGRRVYTIDWRYRIGVALWRAIPRPLYERIPIWPRAKSRRR